MANTFVRRLSSVLGALYFALGIAHLIYSEETGTGLGGWLTGLQLRVIGTASTTMTFLAGFAVLMAPLGIAWLTWGDVTRDATPDRPGKPLTALQRWMIVFLVAVILGAIPLVFYALDARQFRADDASQVYPIKLGGPIPADVRLADLSNYDILDAQVTFEKKKNGVSRSSKTWIAIVALNWKGEPVSVFLKNPRRKLPEHLSVRLEKGGLPVYVEWEFERRKVKIAESYYVAQEVEFRDGKVARDPSDETVLLWASAVMAGIPLLIGGFIVLFAGRFKVKGHDPAY